MVENKDSNMGKKYWGIRNNAITKKAAN